MTVAVVIPTSSTNDQHRAAALVWVARWWREQFAGFAVEFGECDSPEWSKGAAVADGVARCAAADVLVLADADSFTFEPASVAAAVSAVAAGAAPWAIPHGRVYRLNRRETERLYDDPRGIPRLGALARPAYPSVPGGGITVVSREAFELVGGIDHRFRGWGGEDLAFGWALHTLAGAPAEIGGKLVHLWHPHPAPTLRGSAHSEALVALYRSARGLPARMAATVAGGDWTPPPELAEPVRFRMMANRKIARLANGELVRFDRRGLFETTDPELAELLRQQSPTIVEVRR